jgi:hypothetical protein
MDAVTGHGEELVSITQHRIRSGGRAFTFSLGLGILGLLATAVFYFAGGPAEHSTVLAGYLVAFAYWVGIVVTATIWNAIFHAAAAKWMIVLRRVLEGIGSALPVFILLFIPILLGMAILFPWVRPSRSMSAEELELLSHKAPYLTVQFFLIRAVIYFAVWWAVSDRLRRWSLRQDEVGGTEPTRLMRWLGAGSLPFLALTITFAGFDWLMSVDPFWISTIFGVYYFAGSFLSAMCVVAVVIAINQNNPTGLGGAVTRHHLYNVGKLMLAFVAFWTYSAFSQFMLIWIANIPEESAWYVVRMKGGWANVGLFLIVCNFFIPFFALLSRSLKLRPRVLAVVAVWLMVVHYIDIYWLVMPALFPDAPHPHLAHLAALLGVGGIAVATALWRAQGHFAIPVKDPNLSYSLRYTQP